MGEKRYIISDASKMLGVESHVLRYWEEELNVSIPRNEMGHRYYTENHINLLKNVRDLKDQGYSLRTIKMMLTDPDRQDGNKGMVMTPAMQQNRRLEVSEPSGSKMEQFQEIMDKVVAKAMKQQTAQLGKEVSGHVSETVLKEMNYLMRIQDEKEEERYKKLDEVMRSRQQMSRRERKKKLKAEKLLLKKSDKSKKKQLKTVMESQKKTKSREFFSGQRKRKTGYILEKRQILLQPSKNGEKIHCQRFCRVDQKNKNKQLQYHNRFATAYFKLSV